jgi:hypothetical protein
MQGDSSPDLFEDLFGEEDELDQLMVPKDHQPDLGVGKRPCPGLVDNGVPALTDTVVSTNKRKRTEDDAQIRKRAKRETHTDDFPLKTQAELPSTLQNIKQTNKVSTEDTDHLLKLAKEEHRIAKAQFEAKYGKPGLPKQVAIDETPLVLMRESYNDTVGKMNNFPLPPKLDEAALEARRKVSKARERKRKEGATKRVTPHVWIDEDGDGATRHILPKDAKVIKNANSGHLVMIGMILKDVKDGHALYPDIDIVSEDEDHYHIVNHKMSAREIKAVAKDRKLPLKSQRLCAVFARKREKKQRIIAANGGVHKKASRRRPKTKDD